MPQIELRNVGKSFGTFIVCHDINLVIREGEFLTLLGTSGCGKTTTLNMLAGLEEISSGDLLLDGVRANHLAPTERDVAMVFQNYALYPHMTVARNIGFTLKMRGVSRDEITRRVTEVAQSLELGHLLDRLPSQLSGGQQQRVAIGRAIVRRPKIFLFDEPFSNLDATLRVRMRAEVKDLHRRLGVTSVFVTHDQEEALSISDRIAVMRGGVIEQVGTPEEIYLHPATSYVAGFIGNPQITLLSGRVQASSGQLSVVSGAAELPLPPDADVTPGQAIEFAVRPEQVQPDPKGHPATVTSVQPVGAATHVGVMTAFGPMVASLPRFARLNHGETITLGFEPAHMLLFDATTGRSVGRRPIPVRKERTGS